MALALAGRRPDYPLLRCLIWLSGAGLFYLIAVATVLRSAAPSSSKRASLRIILLAAVVFRLTLLPVTPRLSSQLWRFHWDAKIQHLGFNPYAFAPDNALFNPIRTQTDRLAPEPAVAAFYPPLGELLFRWGYDLFGGGLRSQKVMFTLLDLLVLILLTRMLRARGLPPEWVVVYAWSPLAVFEIAGNGHMESAVALLALLALHWAGRRPRPAAIAIASAALTQWYGLLFAPSVLAAAKRKWTGAVAWFVVWPALLSLPYLFINRQWTLPRIAANLRAHLAAAAPFNASLYALVQAWFGHHAGAILAVALVAAVVVVTGLRKIEPLRAAYLILGALLLTMPRVYPWHVLWLLPLLAFIPEAPWLYFSVAVPWAYALGQDPRFVWIEYLPLFALLAWQARGFRGAKKVAETLP